MIILSLCIVVNATFKPYEHDKMFPFENHKDCRYPSSPLKTTLWQYAGH